MSSKKPVKNAKNDSATKKKDGDDEVLFEGELTWTHAPIAASPELMKRTPRIDPSKQEAHEPLPNEGAIEIQKVSDGTHEIFSKDAVTADHPQPAHEPAARIISTKANSSHVTKADTVPHDSSQTDGSHNRTMVPPTEFSKDMADPFAADLNQKTAPPIKPAHASPPATARASDNGTVAAQFADSDVAPPTKPRSKLLGFGLAAALLIVAGGVVAYMLLVVPNKPDNILMKALANSLQQQSVSFALDAQQADTAGKQQMHFIASGGVSQVGSLNMTATLAEPGATTPIYLAVRSIDGSDSYIQFSNLAANQAYITKLGVPADSQLAAQEGKWLSIPADVRPNMFNALGLGEEANWSLDNNDQKAINDIYKHNKFLSVAEKMPEEMAGGQTSAHYKLAVDRTQLTAFMIAAKGRVKTLGITQKQIDAANKFNATTQSLEVWIGKESKLITQVQTAKQNQAGTYTAKLMLPKYNETLSLQQPTAETDLVSALRPFVSPTATDIDGQALLTKILSNYSLAQP